MTRLMPASVALARSHGCPQLRRGREGRSPCTDVSGHRSGPPKSLFCSLSYRYFDEPVELRSSSFSSWDDSSDSYWKKETVKDTDIILKPTGYTDRYEYQSSGIVNSDSMHL